MKKIRCSQFISPLKQVGFLGSYGKKWLSSADLNTKTDEYDYLATVFATQFTKWQYPQYFPQKTFSKTKSKNII
jgi:hypothetical protein